MKDNELTWWLRNSAISSQRQRAVFYPSLLEPNVRITNRLSAPITRYIEWIMKLSILQPHSVHYLYHSTSFTDWQWTIKHNRLYQLVFLVLSDDHDRRCCAHVAHWLRKVDSLEKWRGSRALAGRVHYFRTVGMTWRIERNFTRAKIWDDCLSYRTCAWVEE